MTTTIAVIAIALIAVAVIIGLGWVQNARNRAATRKSLARLDGYNAEEIPEGLATQAIPDALARNIESEDTDD